jgi:hypothetical protein
LLSQLFQMDNNNHIEEHKPVTVDDLKKLQSQLREYNLQWMQELIDQIKADASVEKVVSDDVNMRKVYNVFNGIVSNGKWRLLIFTQGSHLLKHYQSQVPTI